MDIKKMRTRHARVLITSIVICLLFSPNSYSSIYDAVEIKVSGNWNSDKLDRSLPTIPITVYLIDYYINIQNEKPDCDITVSIIDSTTGNIVYQQAVPKAATANIMIPIINLPSGEYVLELIGPSTRHLEGSFSK